MNLALSLIWFYVLQKIACGHIFNGHKIVIIIPTFIGESKLEEGFEGGYLRKTSFSERTQQIDLSVLQLANFDSVAN